MQGRNSEIFDCGLVLKQNGNAVPNWVRALAFMALKAFIIAQRQGFAAHGTNEDFEQVGRDWHGAILTVVSGQLTVATMST
jgi:hypothetical protein